LWCRKTHLRLHTLHLVEGDLLAFSFACRVLAFSRRVLLSSARDHSRKGQCSLCDTPIRRRSTTNRQPARAIKRRPARPWLRRLLPSLRRKRKSAHRRWWAINRARTKLRGSILTGKEKRRWKRDGKATRIARSPLRRKAARHRARKWADRRAPAPASQSSGRAARKALERRRRARWYDLRARLTAPALL
jgi:hypothetical protein